MKVLVTGGAGYIGSHALARRGFKPITYANLSRGNRWAVKWGPLEEGEIADVTRLRSILDRYQPVAVMHFAAFAYGARMLADLGNAHGLRSLALRYFNADLARAHVLALQHLLDNGDSIAVNLGTGHGASVRQVVDTARRITGLEIVARDASRRAGDPPVLVADAKKGQRGLGLDAAVL
jgi:UDP-glucose 4-epimerase